MQLCLTLEHRFLQTPDKKIWTITQCPYGFYREYLQVFDQVRVISRVFPVSKAEPNFLPVEGPGVEFYAMPGYKGPYGFLAQFASVRTKAKHAVPSGSAVILRVQNDTRQQQFTSGLLGTNEPVVEDAGRRRRRKPRSRRQRSRRRSIPPSALR